MDAKEVYLECAEICSVLLEADLTPIRLVIDENSLTDLQNDLRVSGRLYCVSFPYGGEIPIQAIPSKNKILSFVVKK